MQTFATNNNSNDNDNDTITKQFRGILVLKELFVIKYITQLKEKKAS